MRDRVVRTAALILGVLGVPSLVWHVVHASRLGWIAFALLGMEVVVVSLFLSFGLGVWPMTPPYPPCKKDVAKGEEWGEL